MDTLDWNFVDLIHRLKRISFPVKHLQVKFHILWNFRWWYKIQIAFIAVFLFKSICQFFIFAVSILRLNINLPVLWCVPWIQLATLPFLLLNERHLLTLADFPILGKTRHIYWNLFDNSLVHFTRLNRSLLLISFLSSQISFVCLNLDLICKLLATFRL